MIRLVGEKRIAWHKIRAEYITGVSQRKLAEKYHVSRNVIAYHCRLEKWSEQRDVAKAEVAQSCIRKTADIAAENAVRAQRIKTRLLEKLEALMEEQLRATEERQYEGNNVVAINRLRDLTAAYKDLTGDMPKGDGADIEDLSPLAKLLREGGGA